MTGTTVEPLYRVLRALASIGVFDEHDPRRLSLTPMGEFLRTDADVWEYRRAHPPDGEVFDAAMRTLAAADVQARISVYDFGRHRVIADIGGGTGANLASILAVVPQAQGHPVRPTARRRGRRFRAGGDRCRRPRRGRGRQLLRVRAGGRRSLPHEAPADWPRALPSSKRWIAEALSRLAKEK